MLANRTGQGNSLRLGYSVHQNVRWLVSANTLFLVFSLPLFIFDFVTSCFVSADFIFCYCNFLFCDISDFYAASHTAYEFYASLFPCRPIASATNLSFLAIFEVWGYFWDI